MEESKAIHRLAEAQDLVGMVEDMLGPDMLERLSPAAWSGIRITLRSVRDMIGGSHAVMASDLVQRSKSAMSNSTEKITRAEPTLPVATQASSNSTSTDSIRINAPLSRRDLKASLERLVDR